MKKIGIIILLTAIIGQGFSQKLSADSTITNNTVTEPVNTDNTKVYIGKNLITVEENDSSVNVRIGKRGVDILESLEGTKFNYRKYEEFEDEDNDD